jgi:hypothetical protein
MPVLVRYPEFPAAEENGNAIFQSVNLTRRERRLYVALAVVLSLNLSVICGALTFFGFLFDR